MIPVLAAFAATFSMIFGAYWAFVVRPEQQSHEAIWKRLKTAGPPSRVRSKLLKQAQRLSAIPTFDRALQRGRSVVGPVELLIEQSGARLTVGTFVAASALCGLIAGVLVARVTGAFLAGAGAAGLAATVPTSVLRFLRTRRLLRFEEQFPEALDLMSRALKAGHAFTTGLAMVAEEMPDPIGPEFRLLYEQQNFGMPLPDALKHFADRIPLLDGRFFVTAVLTQREAGGNLSEILDNLSSVIRDRFKVKRQIRVISAHGRLTGWVLVAVPPGLALVLFLINPNHWKTLTGNPLGVKLIISGVVLQIMGTLIIRKLIQIEY